MSDSARTIIEIRERNEAGKATIEWCAYGHDDRERQARADIDALLGVIDGLKAKAEKADRQPASPSEWHAAVYAPDCQAARRLTQAYKWRYAEVPRRVLDIRRQGSIDGLYSDALGWVSDAVRDRILRIVREDEHRDSASDTLRRVIAIGLTAIDWAEKAEEVAKAGDAAPDVAWDSQSHTTYVSGAFARAIDDQIEKAKAEVLQRALEWAENEEYLVSLSFYVQPVTAKALLDAARDYRRIAGAGAWKAEAAEKASKAPFVESWSVEHAGDAVGMWAYGPKPESTEQPPAGFSGLAACCDDPNHEHDAFRPVEPSRYAPGGSEAKDDDPSKPGERVRMERCISCKWRVPAVYPSFSIGTGRWVCCSGCFYKPHQHSRTCSVRQPQPGELPMLNYWPSDCPFCGAKIKATILDKAAEEPRDGVAICANQHKMQIDAGLAGAYLKANKPGAPKAADPVAEPCPMNPETGECQPICQPGVGHASPMYSWKPEDGPFPGVYSLKFGFEADESDGEYAESRFYRPESAPIRPADPDSAENRPSFASLSVIAGLAIGLWLAFGPKRRPK